MAWALRSARRRDLSMSTWPMASATGGSGCTFHWVSHFEDHAEMAAQHGDLDWAAGRGTDRRVVRLFLLGAGHAVGHTMGLGDRRRTTGRAGQRCVRHDLGRDTGW